MFKASKILRFSDGIVALISFCAFITITVCIIWSNIPLHSDALYYDAFVENLKISPSNWVNWRLTPAPAFFPDIIFYFLGSLFLASPHERLFFLNLTQWIQIIVGSMLILKMIGLRFSEKNLTLFFAFWSFFLLSVVQTNQIWLLHLNNNGHSAANISPLFILYFTQQSLVSRRNYIKNSSAIGILIILCVVSDRLTLLTLSAPLLISILWLHLKGNSETIFSQRKNLIILVTATSGLGALFGSVLIPNNSVGLKANLSVQGIQNSWQMLLQNIGILANTSNIGVRAIEAATLAGFFFLLLHFESIRNKRYTNRFTTLLTHENESILFLSIFTTASLGITLLGSIFSGGFQDPFALRYLNLPFLLCLLVFFAVTTLFIRTDDASSTKTALVYFVSIILLFQIHVSAKGIDAQPYENNRGGVPIPFGVAKCIDNLQSDGANLHKGIAPYWHARYITYASKSHLSIAQVDENASPFFWMTDLSDYVYAAGHKMVDFAIVLPSGSAPWDFSKETFTKIEAPLPDHKYSCPEGVEVWHWADNRFSDFIYTRWDRIIHEQAWRYTGNDN